MTCPDCNEIEAVKPGGICQGCEIKMLQREIHKLRNALGQLKNMADDCQHMSRWAAAKFIEVVDLALKRSEG
jgi:hypothetical protein